jgi:ABC-type Mn2+/Zn2+ transport system ATPase subunit
MEKILSIKNLSCKMQNNIIFENVFLDIEFEDFISIVGPNGAGKSTFLKTLIGSVKKNTGTIFFSKKSKISFIPQVSEISNHILISNLEVIKTGFIDRFFFRKNEIEKKINFWAEQFKIKDFLYKKFSEISVGQKQKILFIRSIVSDPNFLILDEPSSCLDQNSKEDFFFFLRNLNIKNKITILIVSHDINQVCSFSKKILLFEQGITFLGSPKEFCDGDFISKGCFIKCKDHIMWHNHGK